MQHEKDRGVPGTFDRKLLNINSLMRATVTVAKVVAAVRL
jgi:hypothetical protein